jgi:polysaccharide chain length determinant protein (PEP-CTERM system associated)
VIPGKVYKPEEVASLLLRGSWIIGLGLVLGAGAAAGVSWFIPNEYRSETLVLVIPQRVPENYVQSTVSTRLEDRIQSIREQILTRSRLEGIIEEFDLYADERKELPMEDVIADMKLKVVTRVTRTDAFTVSFVGDTPEIAQKVTARLSSMFTEENMRDRTVIAETTNQFLQTQLDAAKQQLSEREKLVQDFRLKYAGELPDQVQTNLSSLQNVEIQLQTLTESMNRDRERRTQLERLIAESSIPEPPAVITVAPAPANAPQTPDQQLETAESNLRSMRTRLTPDHPDVVRATLQVERMRKEVATQNQARGLPEAPSAPRVSQAETMRRSRLAGHQSELQGLLAQMEQKQRDEVQLRESVSGIRRRLDAAPIRQSELTSLNRDYQTLERNYQDLLRRYEDSKVAANMERRQIGEQFREIDPARIPESPYKPNRLLITGIGAAMGLLIGVGIVGLREFLNRGLRTADDVLACLDLPVLATLPVTSAVKHRSSWRRAAGAGQA